MYFCTAADAVVVQPEPTSHQTLLTHQPKKHGSLEEVAAAGVPAPLSLTALTKETAWTRLVTSKTLMAMAASTMMETRATAIRLTTLLVASKSTCAAPVEAATLSIKK